MTHAFNGCTHWRNGLKPNQLPVLGMRIRIQAEHELLAKSDFTAIPESLHTLARDPRLCLTALEDWNPEEEENRPHWTGVFFIFSLSLSLSLQAFLTRNFFF